MGIPYLSGFQLRPPINYLCSFQTNGFHSENNSESRSTWIGGKVSIYFVLIIINEENALLSTNKKDLEWKEKNQLHSFLFYSIILNKVHKLHFFPCSVPWRNGCGRCRSPFRDAVFQSVLVQASKRNNPRSKSILDSIFMQDFNIHGISSNFNNMCLDIKEGGFSMNYIQISFDDVAIYGIIFLLVIALIFIISYTIAAIKTLKEYERALVFRLGRFVGMKGPGLIWIIPKIDKIMKIDLRTVTYDARTIRVITKDNIRCDVDSFVYYRVVDPKKAVLEVEDYIVATQNLAKTVLRDVLGSAELDEILANTSEFTLKIQTEIDEKTNPWGIKVSDVAVSDIILPKNLQRAIAKQAEAERERRSRIIIAEGEFMAANKMMKAAEIYSKSPIALKLRELHTLTDIARERNLVVVTSTANIGELGNMIGMTRIEKQSSQSGK